MLLPEQMTKILIVGSKDKLKETIDELYRLEEVHPIDFSAEEEGFTLGTPLPDASETSQRLLKLRAVSKDLAVEDRLIKQKIETEQIHKEIDDALVMLEAEIRGAVETRDQIQIRKHDLEGSKRLLEPFVPLGIGLDLYRGYESIVVFTGTVRMDPEPVLRESIHDYELFMSEDGKFVALFVAKAEAAEAQRVLVQAGFSEVQVPPGKGNPEDAIRSIDTEIEVLDKALADAEGKVAKLREKHEAFILASNEELTIEIEKAEFPLRAGATAHAFVVDAWVPSGSLDVVVKAISARLGDDIHVEVVEDRVPRKEHVHAEEAGVGVAEEHVKQEPPVKLGTKKPVGMFTYLTELISVPKYNEIDPTNVLAITFPLFFGLMVGDLAYGIGFMILGYIGLRHVRSAEWKTISTMLLFGGIWATIFGLFLFGEAFGLHFAPQWAAGASHIDYPYGDELSWSSMLQYNLPTNFYGIPLGIYSKLSNVKILLYIAVWIGIIHLFIGYGLGFFNESMRHGFKHAIMHKFSWILILLGGSFLLLYVIDLLILNLPVGFTDPRLLLGLAFLIPGIVIAFIGEGGQSILELPGLMSNAISYTRLAAIGMAKAGMALAFNMIAIEMLASAGGAMLIFGIVVFALGHLTIFVLAVLSAGLHSVRLHYVELFTKFYSGGGSKFDPLRIVRKYTAEKER
ncbi:MAG: V-type ATP synthase subunit I [Methanomassiliicoccales archaeon]|nr:V-type ATP synthase subunit I [Methanomassiliicoccales archaeon]